ncbi:hypothetical protein VPHK46_0036 [Vibrio phage K46]
MGDFESVTYSLPFQNSTVIDAPESGIIDEYSLLPLKDIVCCVV